MSKKNEFYNFKAMFNKADSSDDFKVFDVFDVLLNRVVATIQYDISDRETCFCTQDDFNVFDLIELKEMYKLCKKIDKMLK